MCGSAPGMRGAIGEHGKGASHTGQEPGEGFGGSDPCPVSKDKGEEIAPKKRTFIGLKQ